MPQNRTFRWKLAPLCVLALGAACSGTVSPLEAAEPSGTPGQEASDAGGPPSAPFEPGLRLVTTDQLNLRDAPSLEARVLRVLPPRADLTVRAPGGQVNGFVPVTHASLEGFAAALHLAAAPDLGLPDPSCEARFFRRYFDRDNGPGLSTLREESLAHLKARAAALSSCGAKVTLGGMLSLMIYEGGGAKVAFYNDRCSENSYDKSERCWLNPKARYSYQLGLAPVHTSNFHPCADPSWTGKMRARLERAIRAAGFAPSPEEISSVAPELHTFCPGAEPTLVDYYILGAHSVFGLPTSGVGNDLAHAGVYPFFLPRVVVDVFFDGLEATCAQLTSDRAAIGVWGGGDPRYDLPEVQTRILALWEGFRTSQCAE